MTSGVFRSKLHPKARNEKGEDILPALNKTGVKETQDHFSNDASKATTDFTLDFSLKVSFYTLKSNFLPIFGLLTFFTFIEP